MGSRENFKQEKDKWSRKVFGVMERIYSGGGYLGKKRKSKKCREVNKGIWEGGSENKITRKNRKEEGKRGI